MTYTWQRGLGVVLVAVSIPKVQIVRITEKVLKLNTGAICRFFAPKVQVMSPQFVDE